MAKERSYKQKKQSAKFFNGGSNKGSKGAGQLQIPFKDGGYRKGRGKSKFFSQGIKAQKDRDKTLGKVLKVAAF